MQCMMNLIRSILFVLSFAPTLTLTEGAERRTDGPPGSEYGDFSSWDGQFQLGARFGASVLSNGDKSSFLLGADADYRPTDLFGFKLTFEQAIQKPRLTLVHFAPLVHSEFSNLKLNGFFGPGISIVSNADTKLKFSMAGGVGGDFMMTERFSFGMVWSYCWIFDSVDTTTIAARFGYSF